MTAEATLPINFHITNFGFLKQTYNLSFLKSFSNATRIKLSIDSCQIDSCFLTVAELIDDNKIVANLIAAKLIRDFLACAHKLPNWFSGMHSQSLVFLLLIYMLLLGRMVGLLILFPHLSCGIEFIVCWPKERWFYNPCYD